MNTAVLPGGLESFNGCYSVPRQVAGIQERPRVYNDQISDLACSFRVTTISFSSSQIGSVQLCLRYEFEQAEVAMRFGR